MRMKNAWMIRAGQGGYLINQFAKGYVAVGWSQLGDLTGIKSREEFKQLWRKADPRAKPGKVAAVGAVLHKFCNVIQVGDAVITYDPNTREYLVGEITSPYRYDASLKDHPNVRDVKWQSRVSRTHWKQAHVIHSEARSRSLRSVRKLGRTFNLSPQVRNKRHRKQKRARNQTLRS